MVDVVAALDDLRAALAWPDESSVDLTSQAMAGLGPRDRRRARWPVAAAVGVVVIGVGVPAAAHYLSVGGVRIRLTGDVPDDIGTELQLGGPTALREDAPRPPSLGSPAAAFEGRPAGGYTEVWPGPVLVTSFPGDVTDELIEKRVFGAGTVVPVTVDGDAGYWIEGYHAFLYLDERGEAQEDTLRLSGSALVWSRDGTTYRLETPDRTLAESLALAESMF